MNWVLVVACFALILAALAVVLFFVDQITRDGKGAKGDAGLNGTSAVEDIVQHIDTAGVIQGSSNVTEGSSAVTCTGYLNETTGTGSLDIWTSIAVTGAGIWTFDISVPGLHVDVETEIVTTHGVVIIGAAENVTVTRVAGTNVFNYSGIAAGAGTIVSVLSTTLLLP
jgi:hypothetical protein